MFIYKKNSIILIGLIFILITGCHLDKGEESLSYQNNNLNKGSFIKIGEKEYFFRENDNKYELIKRVNEKEDVLCKMNEMPFYLNFFDENTLIFSTNNAKLYSVDLKKKYVKKITDDIDSVLVVDKYAYCGGTLQSAQQLFRVNVKTGEKTLIADDFFMWFDVFENHIYYRAINLVDGDIIVKQNLNNLSEKEVIYNGGSSNIKVINGVVYFIDDYGIAEYGTPNYKIYRILPEGSILQVTEHRVGMLYNVHDDWIYYSNIDDSKKLYRVKIDGAETEKILDESIDVIEIFGDELYCYNSMMYDDNIGFRIDLNTFKSSDIRF